MGEIDKHFMESLEREMDDDRRGSRSRGRFLFLCLVLIAVGLGIYVFMILVEDPHAGQQLPPDLPPPTPQASLPVSEKAKETGKSYYEEHVEIQSALADYARRILKGQLDIRTLGPLFQPVASYTWDKWYYDTVPVKEGFKTHKNLEPSAHPYTEDHAMITYTITDDDKYGAWGVGIKYAAALGVDITNPKDKEIASLVAAYVWLQSDSRLLYDKGNYFDAKGVFNPKQPKRDINRVNRGDQLLFPHLNETMLHELVQSPQKYLEGTAPSVAPLPPEAKPQQPPPSTPASS
jgi:hypothetical protein